MRREKLFGNIDFGLYASLLFLGLLPAIYMAVRTNLVGQLPEDYSYSIAGQLSWVNLLYEVVNLPMTQVTGLCLPCGQTTSYDAFRIRLFA